jgi:hypothetical protein
MMNKLILESAQELISTPWSKPIPECTFGGID